MAMMQVFVGSRKDGKVRVTVNGVTLNCRNDLWNHSPDGPNWGYGGSGPAQLALGILAAVLGNDQLALRLYQRFKEEVIAPIDSDMWTLMDTDVRAWLDRTGLSRCN